MTIIKFREKGRGLRFREYHPYSVAFRWYVLRKIDDILKKIYMDTLKHHHTTSDRKLKLAHKCFFQINNDLKHTS